MKVLYLILVATIFILGSCVNLGSWNSTQTIPNEDWSMKTKYSFPYQSDDTISTYKILLDIRHTAQYKYSNLYLFVTTKAPNGQSIKDTLEFVLANVKGQWIGSGLSDVKELRLKYKSNVKFAQKGVYTFEIEQAMRDDVLKHITDVGLRIEKE